MSDYGQHGNMGGTPYYGAHERTQRVRIVDPEHPHYPETGVFTGEIIEFTHFAGRMAKIALDGCVHGVDACFVSPGQIEVLR